MAEDDVCSFSGVQTIELARHHLYILAKAGRRPGAELVRRLFYILIKWFDKLRNMLFDNSRR